MTHILQRHHPQYWDGTTTRAVVYASVVTLVTDYFLSNILLQIIPPSGGGP